MKVSQVFSGEYLTAADLQGQEHAVVIAGVEMKKFDDGNKLMISFQGRKKNLVANKTNSNRIAMMYGDDTDGWIGKEVLLYVDWVDYQGKTVEAIRIRPPAKAAPQKAAVNDDPVALAKAAYARQMAARAK